MNRTIKESVRFDIERLFNGAIDIDWVLNDQHKAAKAAASFVFHGPAYHGIAQKDIASSGHRLIDSASFVKNIIASLANNEEKPFMLAIAGFGSGKSHLALTLAKLLEIEDVELQASILEHIGDADKSIAQEIKNLLPQSSGRVLVITLNGMNNFDLGAEILCRVKNIFSRLDIPTEPLDGLRKRFANAANILHNFDENLLSPLLAELNVSGKDIIIERLSAFDETTYARVHDFLESLGIPLIAIGDETAKDVLKLLVAQYVGEGKTFNKILIMFDEFGRYMEFATANSQIAGNGALQQLYEGVQENSDKISFIGFIQYELKAYEQRLPSDFKNEIRRFITRFQSADKLHLSINLETLIASLLVKSEPMVSLDTSRINKYFEQILHWYPSANNHSLWSSLEMFSRVIGQGCWPLSPIAVWVLFHLSAGGQYLQQRSALSLLKASLESNSNFALSETHPCLPPVRLWSNDLQKEFEDVEEQAGRGAIMQSYCSVFERYQQHLTDNDILLLRSIVLVTVTRLKASGKEDAINALRVFSGIDGVNFDNALLNLENEFNVISWDDSFHQFDIIGDSVSKSQFLRFIRKKLETEYDIEQQEKLFIKKASLASEYLKSIECDFAGSYNILSSEWAYDARFSYWSLLKITANNIITALLETAKFNTVDTARGLIIYCYVPANENRDDVLINAHKILRSAAKNNNVTHLPIIIAFIFDNGEIGKAISEIDIVDKLSGQEQEMYGKVATIYANRQHDTFRECIKMALLQRNYITTFSEDGMPQRLAQIGSVIFEKIFSKILPFPFDAYKSSRTNAAKDCSEFTRKLLLQDNFTYDDVQAMPIQQRNRITTVLKTSWRAFNTDGSVAAQPGQNSARSIIVEWDKLLYGNKELNCCSALEIACAPPYGANIASAGLLFSLYIQSRQNILIIIENNERTEFSALCDRIFDGPVLSTKTLQGLTLFKVENNDSEWEQLLNDWGNAASYIQLLDFYEHSKELEARIAIPRAIRWKAQDLCRKSEDARLKIEDAEEKEDKAFGIIERAIGNNDILNLSYGASLLQAGAKKKAADPMWRQEDYTPLGDKITEAKQIIIQYFEQWLYQQRPTSRTSAGLTEFKALLIDKVGRNLKELQLSQQIDLLERYYNNISKTFEAVAECQQVITGIDNWLAGNAMVREDITLAQIKVLSNALREQAELLKRPKMNMTRIKREDLVSEITQRIDKLSAIDKKLNAKKKEISNKASSLWGSVLSPESVDELNGKILDLEYLYAGSESDVTDFREMKNAILSYIEMRRLQKSLSLGEDDYKARFATSSKDFLTHFGDIELPWDLADALRKLEKHCSDYRSQASKEWIANMTLKMSELETMPIAQANELLSNLNSPPCYVNLQNKNVHLENLRAQAEKYLSSKEIEWLLSRFMQLTDKTKKEFLQAIMNIGDKL